MGILKIEARVVMMCTNIALRFCRFRLIRRVLIGAARILRGAIAPSDFESIVREVERTRSRCQKSGDCLAAALTAEALLTQHGHEAVLCIGAKHDQGIFKAHAWVERDDLVVIGGPKELTMEYTRFPAIKV